MLIKDKIIVLTGASGGIGGAIARLISSHGGKLILVGRDETKLNQLNQELNHQHIVVPVDLSTNYGRHKLSAQCSNIGKIDLLINNAGISHFSTFDRLSDTELTNLIQVNLTSPMLLTKILLPFLHNSETPIILNIGSVFGSIGYPCFVTYCASKFGLRGFSQALKRELQDQNVKVLYIAPRATNTTINSATVNQLNQSLGNKTDTPEKVANRVIKQLVKGSANVTIGWPEKLFVKVNALLPAVVDSSISKQLQKIKIFANLSEQEKSK